MVELLIFKPIVETMLFFFSINFWQVILVCYLGLNSVGLLTYNLFAD